MSGSLQGIRVLDFSVMMAGPYCTRMLADLGAEVIKVEPPEGDHIRGRPPVREGHSAYYGNLNCGKQSLAVDLRKDEGRSLVRELAAKVDVVVESFRPGVMKRLGLDYDAFARANPRLVYCSISGFGQNGAAAQRPAYAPIVHAASGYDLANFSYQDGIDRPLKTGIFIADVLSGSLGFGAICAALARRALAGHGEYIDLALMDAMYGLMVFECMEAQFPVDRRRPLYRPVRARDGFVILAPVSPNNFEDMAHTAGHPEWITDERFSTATAREHNWNSLMDLLDQWAADKSAAESEAAMQAGGVPCSRYYTVRESMASPYARERGSFATVRDRAGEYAVPNPAFKLRHTQAAAQPWVAEFGAHNNAVLGGMLGRSREEIERLYREGVLHGGSG